MDPPAPSHPLILSIDAGTTGITVLVVDSRGLPVARAYREFAQHFPRPGWVEHDPNQIWEAVLECVAGACLNAGGPIGAIGITNQRETTVVWDRKTLKPVHNAIVWQCKRSQAICEQLRSQGHEALVRARTGLRIDPYFCGTKLTWLMRSSQRLRRRAEAGELAFGTVDSWLIARLTGGTVHATDVTNASRTLLFDIHRLCWDEQLLEMMQVPPQLLPEVHPSSHRFGLAAGVAGLDGLPISGVAGDQQAALFGQACFSPGSSKNTYGTGSFVLTNTGTRCALSSHGLLTTVAAGAGTPTYALEGSIFITGAAIQWLRDGLGIIGHASQTEALAASVPDCGGVHFVPALAGLGAPWWDAGARGAITGITRGTGREHILRAAVEAMAFQTKDVAEAMAADSGLPLTELKVDGGASVMDLLCQFQADLLGVPVLRPRITETTAVGAAYLAGLTEGVWSGTAELAEQWRLDRAFEPQRDPDEVRELYSGWKKAVSAVTGPGSSAE